MVVEVVFVEGGGGGIGHVGGAGCGGPGGNCFKVWLFRPFGMQLTEQFILPFRLVNEGYLVTSALTYTCLVRYAPVHCAALGAGRTHSISNRRLAAVSAVVPSKS